jgi:hypothetical protein
MEKIMNTTAKRLAALALSIGFVMFAGCGTSHNSGYSGDWVVDWEKMMASYTQNGADRVDAAMQVAGYSDMRITFSGDTIRMKDGDGFHDCTATIRTISFASEVKLLDALAEFHERSTDDLPEEIREKIRGGGMNVTIAEIVANDNNGEGLDIFEVGQKCIVYAPGPEDQDEMAFTFHWFGDEIAPLALVRADSQRGSQLVRDLEEMENR